MAPEFHAMKRPNSVLLVLALVGVVAFALVRRPRANREAELIPADDPSCEVVQLRILAKCRLARDVADDRRPLLEAAALFRELDHLPPAVDSQPDPSVCPDIRIPFGTEEGRYC